jgi:tRNA pseudouridine55 synthase
MLGVLVLDKPAGLSSAAAVDRVKRALGVRRAGHGGTLDPLATGVLPICLEAATKLAGYLLADDKEYEATGVLGVETDTLDRTGRIVREHAVGVDREALVAALAARTGEQDQIPPMYSALKQSGVRLYERARAGEEVERAPRRIRIDRLELLAFEPPRFRVAITCSKGTYVRSLLADLGHDLGCGAHLAELRRTRSGRFSITEAIALDALDAVDVAARLIPLGRATGLPSVVATAPQLAAIRVGRRLPAGELAAPTQTFQIVDPDGRLAAIAHVAGDHVAYDRVFTADATS